MKPTTNIVHFLHNLGYNGWLLTSVFHLQIYYNSLLNNVTSVYEITDWLMLVDSDYHMVQDHVITAISGWRRWVTWLKIWRSGDYLQLPYILSFRTTFSMFYQSHYDCYFNYSTYLLFILGSWRSLTTWVDTSRWSHSDQWFADIDNVAQKSVIVI